MRFKATDEQVSAILASAFNHSTPVGLGFLHFKPGKKASSEFIDRVKACDEGRSVGMDYEEGRMVKIAIRKGSEGIWEIRGPSPDPSYQSWASRYPSYNLLIEESGAEIF